MFCHLRSRVFANERPTVPSIFNVYGDSGESLMAMIIRTKISTRFRGWFFACTPRCLPRSKKSIAGFTGAVYARVCPSFGCVLPFVYPIYYIRVTMLRFACECARASLSACTIRPTLYPRSFTRIEIRVLRGRRTLASHRNSPPP